MNGDPPKRDVKSHKLFEIATEVANRVGGIYSVLKSKVWILRAILLDMANRYRPQ